MKECLGGQFASPYFTTVTFIVESVLPCTLTAIAFLVSFGVMSQVWIAFWCMYTSMMVGCCSPVCESINGTDRFVVYSTPDVDFARGRGKCAADRRSAGASIGDKDLSGRWRYVGFGPLRWGKSDSTAFGDVAERVSSGVGQGFGRDVITISRCLFIGT